jgi:hypothetical protein
LIPEDLVDIGIYRIVRRTVTLTLLSLGVAARLSSAEAADVKLSGCLIRGADGGYLLTNGPSAPAWQRADPAITPGAVGTSGTYTSVFYWLRDDDDLRAHVGHRVEVEGELRKEIEEGEIKIDRKDKWTELEIKSDGDTLKARIPHLSVVSVGDGDSKSPILVRRVDVGSVRMVAATCN